MASPDPDETLDGPVYLAPAPVPVLPQVTSTMPRLPGRRPAVRVALLVGVFLLAVLLAGAAVWGARALLT